MKFGASSSESPLPEALQSDGDSDEMEGRRRTINPKSRLGAARQHVVRAEEAVCNPLNDGTYE